MNKFVFVKEFLCFCLLYQFECRWSYSSQCIWKRVYSSMAHTVHVCVTRVITIFHLLVCFSHFRQLVSACIYSSFNCNRGFIMFRIGNLQTQFPYSYYGRHFFYNQICLFILSHSPNSNRSITLLFLGSYLLSMA